MIKRRISSLSSNCSKFTTKTGPADGKKIPREIFRYIIRDPTFKERVSSSSPAPNTIVAVVIMG